MHDALVAAALGLIEGLTEFLPISSTGHLILAGHALKFGGAFADSFDVIIQVGAILAVLIFYRKRFLSLLKPQSAPGFSGPRGLFLLVLTTIPALALGFVLHGYIKTRLFTPGSVATALAVGALGILVVERFVRNHTKTLEEMNWKLALGVGLVQCLALWPGFSRSAATILGAMCLGLNRRAATEYSFFAAVPVLAAAAGYDLLKIWNKLSIHDAPLFALGLLVAFFAAWWTIKFLIRYVGSHSFSPFAWYRLALSALVFWLVT